jgi:CheY-like chemotaxis protein
MNSKPLIVVAEDDPDDQYFFQEAVNVLAPLEADTHFTWDGSKLLHYLRGMAATELRRRMVVVLDLNMQVRNGQSTLTELKADPALAEIPVVILTTSSNKADLEDCLHHGASAYYRKPDSIVELVGIVRSLYRDYLS